MGGGKKNKKPWQSFPHTGPSARHPRRAQAHHNHALPGPTLSRGCCQKGRELTVLTTALTASVISSKLSATFSAYTALRPLSQHALGVTTQSTALLYQSSQQCSKVRGKKEIKLQISACAAITSSDTTYHIPCATETQIFP